VKQLKIKIMKKQSNTLFAYLSNEQVNNLTSIVKETLAKGVSPMPAKPLALQTFGISNVRKRVSCKEDIVYKIVINH
jgi:hypothetical protein